MAGWPVVGRVRRDKRRRARAMWVGRERGGMVLRRGRVWWSWALDGMDRRGEMRAKERSMIEKDDHLFPHIHKVGKGREHHISCTTERDGNINRPKQINGQTPPCFNNVG